MNELGITLIPARSPQAKGRIERLWETLQSRLPVEFKIAGITTVDQANVFLVQYIDKFNSLFAVEAQDSESAYRPVPDDVDIAHVLCVKHQRSVDNGGVFSFYGNYFKVVFDSVVPPRARIEVLVSPVFGVKAQYMDTVFETIPYVKPKRSQKTKPKPAEKKSYRPPDSHYYKYGHTLVKKVSFEDSDRDILKMLEEIFLTKYA